MARLEERNYTYFTTVRGMCRECREIFPARVFFRDHQVWQQTLCPVHGNGAAGANDVDGVDRMDKMDRILTRAARRSASAG